MTAAIGTSALSPHHEGRSPFGSPNIEAQLARLRPYFCPEAIIEFRVCGLGKGRKGEAAVQAIADAAGVPVTAPTASISSLAAIGGLAADWRTAYHADWNKKQVVPFWRGDPERRPTIGSTQDIAPVTGRTVTGQFVPLPGVNPPTLTPPATLPAPPRSGLGSKVAAGAAAGAFLVAIGAGVALNRAGDLPPTVASPTSTAAASAALQQGAPHAAAPVVEVRVSPIEAVFNKAAFTTEYSALVSTEPAGAAPALSFAWSGADCGTFGPIANPRTFRWTHPHPPCDPTTDHANRTITLLASWADRQLRCAYQGQPPASAPPCVDVRTGVPVTPVGGGR
ncbi:MAG: hypothetical protein EXR66_01825 [Dehalococcoidia bacterium]|nr:hypothetical protein [Dehalococcoidia bacterium]